jgi:hypothetical protein
MEPYFLLKTVYATPMFRLEAEDLLKRHFHGPGDEGYLLRADNNKYYDWISEEDFKKFYTPIIPGKFRASVEGALIQMCENAP